MQVRAMPHRIAKRRKERGDSKVDKKDWEPDKVCTVQEERDTEEEIRCANKEEGEIGEEWEMDEENESEKERDQS